MQEKRKNILANQKNTNNLKIEELPELPLAIKTAINDKKLAIFIGAGASRLVGCDSWDTLAKNLVKKCRQKGKISPISKSTLLQEQDKIKLISICFNILKKEKEVFYEELKKSLKDSDIDNSDIYNDDKFKIYRDLQDLGDVFITTNADRFIDKLFNENNVIYENKKFNANSINNDKLYKIHGCISDEESLVFTKNKYIEKYAYKDFNKFIDKFFQKYTVLFVGYSLKDFELLSRILKPSQLTERKKHFCLKAYFEHQQQVCNFEYKYFNDLGIKLVPFSRDEKDYKQLIAVINKWWGYVEAETYKIQNNFNEIDEALEKANNIETTIQNMKNNDNQAHYFFEKAHNYQKLHLWLEPLLKNEFLSLNNNKKFKYFRVLRFLVEVTIQNKEQKIPKITTKLLSIANKTIKETTDDNIVWYMLEIIFNLPYKNITVEHIDFINSHIRNHKYKNTLNYNISEIIMPVLIKNKMGKHMLKLLPVIFAYEIKKYSPSSVEPISIIEEYNLQELLEKYSKDIIDLVGDNGIKIIEKLITDITKQGVSMFDEIWLTVIRTKTDDEIKQNNNSNRYDNQLIFFTRDLFESLPSDKIKPYIEDFLLKKQHPIFTRLALHIINCKYSDLKNIFWQWMDDNTKDKRKIIELWTLLKESSEHFTDNEFDKIISWIETFNCKEYRPELSDKDIGQANAYIRKEYLYCLKDNNERAKKLYEEYNSINNTKLDHPGFSYYSLSSFIPEPSYHKKTDLHDDPINTIKNFDPSKIKNKYYSDEAIRGLTNDLSTYIKNNPKKFIKIINDFKNVGYIYQCAMIRGFADAWEDKQKFTWENIFTFIDEQLSPDFFISDENDKQQFVSEIANLIACGTKKDNNAFDKKLLPQARKILFKLLNNKYEEKDNINNNLASYVLNSTNGKVLYALIDYALRYGRRNSSEKVKWEPEIQTFFTDQLKKNDAYSKSVFTMLGSYIHQLQFLDEDWVFKNFDKIFPLKNIELWECSITAYFDYVNNVYENFYKLFQEKGHIEQILSTNFTRDNTKSRLISFICVAYINDMDDKTIFDIIKSKDSNHILKIVSSILMIYRNKKDKKIENKIKKIWHEIYNIDKDDNLDDSQKIFNNLCDWFVFLNKILTKDIELLKYTAQHAKNDYNSRSLIKEMTRLSYKHKKAYKHKKGIYAIYMHMLDNNIYPRSKKEHINKILQNLDEEHRLKIANLYSIAKIYDVIDKDILINKNI